jgi:hypothetical protein
MYSTNAAIDVSQVVALEIGKVYRVGIWIQTATDGGVYISEARHAMYADTTYTTTGRKTITFTATYTDAAIMLAHAEGTSCDITFDDFHIVEVKPLSISAWIAMQDATSFTIASKGIYQTDAEWFFSTDAADKLCFRKFDELAASPYVGRTYDAALTASEDKWIHVTATDDGGIASTGVSLYIDGTAVDDASQEQQETRFLTVKNGTAQVWLGRYNTDYADGLIDDVRFWNKELSDVDVKNIYERTRWRYSK